MTSGQVFRERDGRDGKRWTFPLQHDKIIGPSSIAAGWRFECSVDFRPTDWAFTAMFDATGGIYPGDSHCVLVISHLSHFNSIYQWRCSPHGSHQDLAPGQCSWNWWLWNHGYDDYNKLYPDISQMISWVYIQILHVLWITSFQHLWITVL